MRRMLIHKRLGGVANEKFRHDEQSDIFFTIKCFLKDVTAIAIGSEFDDPTPYRRVRRYEDETGDLNKYLMHDTIFRLSSAVDAASRHRWTAQLPNLRVEGKVVNSPKKRT
jgi:hypothetical protein